MFKISKYLLILLPLYFSINYSYANEQNVENAKNFISKVADHAISVIKNDESDKVKSEKLSKMFLENVDIEWMARFVLGMAWKKSTPDQQDNFIKNYKKFLIASYIPNFKKYNSEVIKIEKAKQLEENQYIISTLIDRKNSEDIKVDYMVHMINDKPLIFDIVGEGISLINTQRADFRSILQQNDIDYLSKTLEEKSEMIQSRNSAR